MQKLRKEIQPVASADFMRFLFSWHGLDADDKREGPDALKEILNQLEGFEAPAASWEGAILPARVTEYDHIWLDMLCLSGNTVWGRFRQNYETNGKKSPSPIKTTPITLVNRVNLDLWKQLSSVSGDQLTKLSHQAREVLAALGRQGASFLKSWLMKRSC